ncbi:mechanosensitive ion channel [Pseudoalteromonas sp. SR44-5]|jgi:small-conductance mechanosensitive channel|uniref:mechanosensitive ion channel family protein n=2 Tax=Pseudoalteromonas TaxID=53246 RepID=UPI001230A28A|nr:MULTISPECIES: mechanosensitive ion channel domain-containing protein [Pseudoalteromonas]MBB1365687.1 mechanosensitive ion channel [Pseudoalteromonas sp. SR44-5]MBB1432830.1 mechanosensitive ion channel [Pseudoalteromonas sp. SG43-6]MBB1479544.1 mechanosensitive ion channel [Pseudoalteromonas sp. SG41-2]
MDSEFFSKQFESVWLLIQSMLSQQATYLQLLVIITSYAAAYWIYSKTVKKRVDKHTKVASDHPINIMLFRLSNIVYPLVAIILLRIFTSIGITVDLQVWLMNTALNIAILLFAYSIIKEFVSSPFMSALFKLVGLPVLLLHLLGFLPAFIKTLEAVSINLGNIQVSLYGLTRVLFFGAILFWLGRASSNVGKVIIRNQQTLDISTREVFTKLFEVGLFCVIALLLLNIMGVNLTALAVFGGALGVGLGLGLQSIASNFISGIIILLDKSLTIGDFVELENGKSGFVREFKMRHAILETYDGKDILVPNETFISSLLTNWTHKDPKQRYRVDFSVAYATDVRAMVEIIKQAVAEHPQVISGPDVPFEERPDCEIDSFGDNGINMFVEFWMQGIDDGKNRVGGDLLLIILETLKAHNIAIPFPQREVRVLNEDMLKKM